MTTTGTYARAHVHAAATCRRCPRQTGSYLAVAGQRRSGQTGTFPAAGGFNPRQSGTFPAPASRRPRPARHLRRPCPR